MAESIMGQLGQAGIYAGSVSAETDDAGNVVDAVFVCELCGKGHRGGSGYSIEWDMDKSNMRRRLKVCDTCAKKLEGFFWRWNDELDALEKEHYTRKG